MSNTVSDTQPPIPYLLFDWMLMKSRCNCRQLQLDGHNVMKWSMKYKSEQTGVATRILQ